MSGETKDKSLLRYAHAHHFYVNLGLSIRFSIVSLMLTPEVIEV
jgi:hypothetical protein